MSEHLILTQADKEVLLALKAEQDKEPSAQAFVTRFLSISATQWSKILNALDPASKSNYFDDISAESGRVRLDELAEVLTKIPRLREQEERVNSEHIFELADFTLIKSACEHASAKSSPERLIKYIAPTGGAKTILCYYLQKHCKARIVESRESWKRSYWTFLQDIAAAIGCRLNGETRPAAMEDAILSFALKQKILLAIDEGEFFGTAALNGIKLLLNRTRLVIVLCAIGEAHDRWNKYYPLESGQLDRRTHCILRLNAITHDDAMLFFPAKQFDDRKAALATLCEAATKFGAYSLLRRVAYRLRGKERVDSIELTSAITASLREMGRSSK